MPTTTHLKSPTTAVFAGGGAKGQANESALKVLDQNGMLQCERVIGSSVGGLTAALLALGNDTDEIAHFLRSGGNGLMDMLASSHVFERKGIVKAGKVIKNLVKSQGVAKGHALLELSQEAVAQKLGKPNATFSELEQRFGQEEGKGRFRNLELTVTVSDPRGNYQIVCSKETTPNMPIALAMRMTAGLPPVFPPILLTPEQLREYTKDATLPLIKYDRGEGFTNKEFSADTFHALTPEEQTDIIQTINQDVIENSIDRDGKIRCSDGGVVDNLPVYLALAHQDTSVDDVVAFNFEEPWRRERRMEAADIYAKDKTITPEDERRYHSAILDVPQNDRAYYLFQRYLSGCRLPPSHHLELLQKGNMLCFDVGDVNAADFELSDEKRQYLLESGYNAAAEFISLKSKPMEQGDFYKMYPEYSSSPEVGLSVKDRARQLEMLLFPKTEQVKSSYSKETLANYYKEVTGYDANSLKDYRELRKSLVNAKSYSKKSEVANFDVEMIPKALELTEREFVQLRKANKDCDIALKKAVKELDTADKFLLKLMQKSTVVDEYVKNKSPDKHQQLTSVSEMQQHSKFTNELIGLTRDPSADLQGSIRSTTKRQVEVLPRVAKRLLKRSAILSSFKNTDQPKLDQDKQPEAPDSKKRKKNKKS